MSRATKRIAKVIVKALRDLVLVGLVFAILAGSLLGVGLPYRFPIAEIGMFQLAAFESGLALYQPRRDDSYYGINPLNDYLIDEADLRQPHFTWEEFEGGDFSSEFTVEDEAELMLKKPEQIIDVIKSLLGMTEPSYWLEKDGMRIEYESKKQGDELWVTKRVTLARPQYVKRNGMAIQYKEDDVVVDVSTGVAFTPVGEEMAYVIGKAYGVRVLPNDKVRDELVRVDGVHIINPSLPGVITVYAGLQHEITMNAKYRLIEIEVPVEEVTDKMTMTVRFQGIRGKEEK